MSTNQTFTYSLRNIQSSNRYARVSAAKEIASYLPEATKVEVQELLELLISTHDVQTQTKLLSIVAAYLINGGVHYEVIVKYNPLYETVQNLLLVGLPMKAAVALNFVLTLVTCDEDQQCLATHARNMLRLSGCLNIMADMFSSSMMYQDTWVALCQSLAEVCRGSEVNQSYCSHLVPLCVTRCLQGNMDVCAVLQSLIHEHDRNSKLFLESDGLRIFTRQALQYNMCMQLLNTVVEKSTEAVSILRETDVIHHLQDFLRLYGPYSQVGQWSTVILYHFNRETFAPFTNKKYEDECHQPLNNSIQKQISHQVLNSTKQNPNTNCVAKQNRKFIHSFSNRSVFLGKAKDIIMRNNALSQPKLFHNINVTEANDSLQNPEDTAHLFQNVIREVICWKSQKQGFVNKRCATPKPYFQPAEKPQRVLNLQQESNFRNHKKPVDETQGIDLTFSFLIQNAEQHPLKESESYGRKKEDSLIENSEYTSQCRNNIIDNEYLIEREDRRITYETKNDESDFEVETFKPPFVSTPKRGNTTKRNLSTITRRRRRPAHPNLKKYYNVSKVTQTENSTYNVNSTINPTKEISKKSMSARLFSAINDSCTTIVKSMKSIFRTKQNYPENAQSRGDIANNSCNFSFTNYMRERDALLEADCSGKDSSSLYKVDSCRTCKDTIILQQKMVADDHLKHTVKKLKTGINLYGCDFKRISKTLWPRDKYMTPEVLYNLYRKLIVKGGHGNHDFRQKAQELMRKK